MPSRFFAPPEKISKISLSCLSCAASFTKYPGIFAAPALRGIHHQTSAPQGDPSKAAGHQTHTLAIKDIRPQINMPRLHVAINKTRCLAERERLLCNVVAWLG